MNNNAGSILNPFVFHPSINLQDSLFRLQQINNFKFKKEIKKAILKDADKKLFIWSDNKFIYSHK